MAEKAGEVYWKLFVSEAERDGLIERLARTGVSAEASPWHGEGYCYVEVTAAQARVDALRQAVRGCLKGATPVPR